jgi:hypothetical protein
MSALFEQERILADAQVKMLPSRNGGAPTRLYRSIVAPMIGLSAVAFLAMAAPIRMTRSDLSSTPGSKVSRTRQVSRAVTAETVNTRKPSGIWRKVGIGSC